MPFCPSSLRCLALGAVAAAALLVGGCDAQGCAAGCLGDCISGCASDCDSCTACDCADCGCSLLPIPGGFPSGQDARGDQRLPNATQVRLSPQGLDFIEDNLTQIVDGAVPGGLDLAVPSGSQGGGAIGTSVNVMVCAEQVLDFTVDGTGVNGAGCILPPFCGNAGGGNTITRTFVAAASGRGLLAAESPFGTTCNTSYSVVDTTAGSTGGCSGGHLAPNANACEFDVVAGHTYTVSANRQSCSLQSARFRVFAPAATGCYLHPELGAPDVPVSLSPTNEFVDARAPLLVTTVDQDGARRAWPMVVYESVIGIGTGFRECTLDIDTRRQNPPAVTLNVEAGIGGSVARPGYGALAIGDFSIDSGSVQVGDIQTDCNAFGLSPQQLVDLVTTFTGDPADTITRAIQQVKNDLVSLCQPAILNPTTGARDICPSGSTAVASGNCHAFTDSNGNGVFDDGEAVSGQCVSQLLGGEVRVDMGDLLGSISPGLRAAVDVLFAAQDDAQGVAGGYTVPFFGGFYSLAQNSTCIDPLSAAELAALDLEQPPNDVALASAFAGGADSHHIQVGLSERVMNWGAYQLWQSGALCIQATTRLDQLLKTATFSVFVRSLGALAFPSNGAPIGIALRPGQPPRVTLGAGTEEDPFVRVDLAELSIDFYVWTTERYARFMTFTADTTINLNVPIDNGTLTPEIVGVELANATVSNNELIQDDPVAVALAMESVIDVALPMVAGAIPSIDVGGQLASAGLPIGFEPLGAQSLRLVEDDLGGGRTERYLGVFLNLTTEPTPLTERTDTRVRLVHVNVPDAAVFELESYGVGERPSVEIEMGADGPEGVEFEYQHRVDDQPWSAWSRSPYAVVTHDALLLQGRHSLEARARVVGATQGTDLTPARVEFLIDVLSPGLETVATSEGTLLRAADAVSYADALEFRFREPGDDAWSEWATLGTPERLVEEALGHFEFQVRDEAGNVGSNTEALRGLPPPSDGGGCGDCATRGDPDAGRPLYGLLMLMALVVLLRRPR
jgi:MYXO-CTERM domain-containing protein